MQKKYLGKCLGKYLGSAEFNTNLIIRRYKEPVAALSSAAEPAEPYVGAENRYIDMLEAQLKEKDRQIGELIETIKELSLKGNDVLGEEGMGVDATVA